MPKPGYVTFQLDPLDLEALRRLADKRGYNLSEISRLAVRRLLKYADDVPPKPREHELERAVA